MGCLNYKLADCSGERQADDKCSGKRLGIHRILSIIVRTETESVVQRTRMERADWTLPQDREERTVAFVFLENVKHQHRQNEAREFFNLLQSNRIGFIE